MLERGTLARAVQQNPRPSQAARVPVPEERGGCRPHLPPHSGQTRLPVSPTAAVPLFQQRQTHPDTPVRPHARGCPPRSHTPGPSGQRLSPGSPTSQRPACGRPRPCVRAQRSSRRWSHRAGGTPSPGQSRLQGEHPSLPRTVCLCGKGAAGAGEAGRGTGVHGALPLIPEARAAPAPPAEEGAGLGTGVTARGHRNLVADERDAQPECHQSPLT